MIINNNVFETFLFDNVDSIKNRIAVQMNTLVKYLIFDPEIKKVEDDTNITVTNILEPVLNKDTLIFPIDEIDENKFKNIPREEFEKFFIFTNIDLNNQQTMLNQNESNESNKHRQNVLDMILLTLENITIDSVKWWKEERNAFKKKYNDEFDKLKNDVEAHTQQSIEFQRITEIDYSNFETTNSQFTINFGPTNMTLAELFNNIQVTKYVPYVNMDKFFKIHYNFIPSSEWLELETKNVILMKVDCELLIELREFKDPHKKYTNAAFTILEEPGAEGPVNRLIATMDMNVGYRNVIRPDFIARVLDALGSAKGLIPSVQKSQIQELSIVGYFSYPFQTMLIPIWVDLAMNNEYFEKVVAINESLKASKSKPNIYLHMLGNGSDSISLVMKMTDRPNMYGMKHEGERYIRSRVKTKTFKDVIKYQKIISRLFTLYNNEKSDILSVYRSFIPNFEEETRRLRIPERTENLGLRAIAPDIFPPNYSRKCLKRPTIISKEKYEEYNQTKEKQTMRFPQNGESDPYYFACYHETHPFIGLRDNQLKNKVYPFVYPYLPCCYSKDQQNREGSKYKHYFEGDELRKKHQQAQDLFVTNKILPPGVAGILPKNISNLFSSLIQTGPLCSFNRIGMNKTINSLLECVLVANNIIPRNVEPKQRAPLLEAERLKLATIQNAMSCKQELYNLSINEIIDQIKSTKYNLNATEFVHLMEEAFKCDIFIFESNNKDPNGSLIIPKHVQSYYKSKPRRQTIFIFQHTGSESDNAEYPQCELIVKKIINKQTQQKIEITSFSFEDPIVVKLWRDVFLKLNRSFIFNVMTPSFSLTNFHKLNINSQIIDIYGKCRVINASTSNSNNFITMISDPIPPFAAISATVVYRASLVNIKIFADTIRAVFVRQRVNKENKVREVNAILGNINVTFLSNDTARLHNVPIVYDDEEYKNIFGKPDNIISRFTMNKRLAKIIFQYMLYIFSIYLNGEHQPLTEIELVDFVNKRIVIIPGYNFEKESDKQGGLSPKFNLNSAFVQNRNTGPKLITTSKEMVRRLMYMLRLYQSNNFEKLVKYKDRINIDDFFEDVFDFEKKSFELLLDGSNSIKGLIESYHTKNTITKNIKHGEIYSYFFYNEHFDHIIFIAQNTDHLAFERGPDGLALAIAFVKFWYQYGYNPHKDILIESLKNNELNLNTAVNIYNYVNDRVINKIGKSSENSNIIPGAVLGYLLNGEPFYTALMPL